MLLIGRCLYCSRKYRYRTIYKSEYDKCSRALTTQVGKRNGKMSNHKYSSRTRECMELPN